MGRRVVTSVIARLRMSPLLADVLVAVALTTIGLLSARTAIDAGSLAAPPPPTAVWVVLTIVLMLPLAARRVAPLTTLLAVTAAFFPYRIAEVPDLSVSVVAWWLALYSAGAYGAARRRDFVRGVNVACTLGFLTYRLLTPDGELASGVALARAAFLLLLNGVFIAAAWVFGNATSARRAGELALARQAVELERVRIARELHDVVAHSVSLMGIEAAAARRIMDRDVAKARNVLVAIEDTSRQAVAELHRLLALLRSDDEVDVLASRPGLLRLNELVREVADAGLPVDVEVRGDLNALPDSVDLSAYRIVQEALTNTIKHASASRASVSVRRTRRWLEIDVVDDGHIGSVGLGTGLGLIGMRERVALHRGRLDAGLRDDGGFGVHAVFPLDGARV